jgi:hypothetical protein
MRKLNRNRLAPCGVSAPVVCERATTCLMTERAALTGPVTVGASHWLIENRALSRVVGVGNPGHGASQGGCDGRPIRYRERFYVRV